MNEQSDFWYIVQCNPTLEKKAADEIRRRGYRAYIPRLAKLRIHHRTQEKSVRYQVLYTGYILARFPEGVYDDLRTCQGVKRIQKNASGMPYHLKGSVVAALLRSQRQMEHDAADARNYRLGRRRGAAHSIDRAIAETMFSQSRHGAIVSGAFTGRDVEVLGITDAGMVRASFDLLGKTVEKLFRPLVEILPINQELVDEEREAA